MIVKGSNSDLILKGSTANCSVYLIKIRLVPEQILPGYNELTLRSAKPS